MIKLPRNESRLFVIKLPEAGQFEIKLPEKLRLVVIKLPEVGQLMIILSIHLSNWLYWKPRSELTKFLSIHPLRLYQAAERIDEEADEEVKGPRFESSPR